MIEMTTRSGQTIRVADDRVASWEARGYKRADQPAPAKSTVKSTAKKAPAKKSAAKKSSK